MCAYHRWVWSLGVVVILASCQSQPPMSAIAENPVEVKNPISANSQHYKNEDLGFAFEYPAGFIMDESEIEQGAIALWTQEDYTAIQNNEFEGSEFPPDINIAVRENSENLPLQDWVMQDSWFVNPTHWQSREVAGREGLAFRGTGLYESQYIVVPWGDRVLVISFAESSAYRGAFEQIATTLETSR